jgi:hypothetical protein
MVSFLQSPENLSQHSPGNATRNALGQPPGHVRFSFADDLLGHTQPVRVTLRDFEHPGEVIVAERWRTEFGMPLSGVSMFRLVLLQAVNAPAPGDILDDRICVAAARVRGDRVGETKATYAMRGPGADAAGHSPQSTNCPNMTAADIRSLREARRSYVTANDPGLGRLASALAMYESEVDASVAARLHEMWKSGVVVTSRRGRAGRPTP